MRSIRRYAALSAVCSALLITACDGSNPVAPRRPDAPRRDEVCENPVFHADGTCSCADNGGSMGSGTRC